ncbi:hypothetical protein [Cytophaga hutchinsonii]|uniref:Uncharacterized protein n=1 Tax=Cytophaga hutchinsonii (strain ATCC 33406 / DSM 1761 / CIP 103989 / NBRC 15051 / NCIMB 9469 / D465) TaxID=269798 RepID=A0A6N4SP59_CYTH3|nr:hypothetical protein [Cytophaga hutchinsonii]ABG58103.1 hypothetical protein CHU_0816 [Cytophaga hutchinsonii ATCC 33406]SFX13576.1 hypothetical protein SAMN04487930_101651 [Cytophaga hutchinsonii ATCC 33406]
MTFDTNTITAFLTGSVVTLIIREIFNQINRKVDFNRDLKKITYQRKLEKAESAVAYYWTYLNKAIEMKKSMETIHKALNEIDETKLDIRIITETLNKNSKTLDLLSGDKYFDINGIHLYFDLEDEKSWSEEDLGKLCDCLAEMNYRGNDVEFWTSLYNSHLDSNEQLADQYWSKMKEFLPDYLNSLQKFIDLLEKNRQATYLIFKKIKKQIEN